MTEEERRFLRRTLQNLGFYRSQYTDVGDLGIYSETWRRDPDNKVEISWGEKKRG